MTATIRPWRNGVTAGSFGLLPEEGPLAQGAFC